MPSPHFMKIIMGIADKLQKVANFSPSIPMPDLNLVNPTLETNKKLAKQNDILDEQSNESKKQTEELIKQTSILDEARELTNKNAEYTKQLLEMTYENSVSAEKQFKSSQTYSIVAIVVAVLSFGIAFSTLIFGVYSSNKTEELYKTQIQNQEETILQLKNTINSINEGKSAIQKTLINISKQKSKSK